MLKGISGFILLLLVTQFAIGQHSKAKISLVTITTSANITVQGILYGVTDSSLAVYTNNVSIPRANLVRDSLPLTTYSYHDIQKIKVRRRISVAEGAVIGGGSGLILGILLDASNKDANDVINGIQSYANGTTYHEASFTPLFTITFTLIGSAVGAIIGSSSKKFQIDSAAERFRATEYSLMKYSFVNPVRSH